MTRGERILELRNQAKWSQADLIEATKKADPTGKGVSQQLVSKLERGVIEDSGKLIWIANALNTTVEYLETGTQVPGVGHLGVSEPVNIYAANSVDHELEGKVAKAVDLFIEKLGYQPSSIETVYYVRELMDEVVDIKESITIPVLVKMLELKHKRG